MKSSDHGKTKRPKLRPFGFWFTCGCLVVLLGWMFRVALKPDYTTFNNDTPLGVFASEQIRPTGFDAMWGVWHDLNWLGSASITAVPNFTRLYLTTLGPLLMSKFYAAFTLLFVGLGAWFCFWRWQFSLPVCFLAALAAVFHGDFFPNSCWGVGSQVIGFGLNFIAIGLLGDQRPRNAWFSVMLAGFAVGLGVTEAYDIGALFSVVVGGFALWRILASKDFSPACVVPGMARVAVVAVLAFCIGAGMIRTLVGTQITGISNMAQDDASKARRWEEATQWSTYKRETISLFVPAFFGFRMDTPKGGEYWGFGGRTENWDRYLAGGPLAAGDAVRVQATGSTALSQPRQLQIGSDGKVALPGAEAVTLGGLSHQQAEEAVKNALTKAGASSVNFQVELPRGMIKFGGGGGYAGAIVLVLAAWAVIQSFRGQKSVFTTFERRMVWFWFAVAVVSMLLSFGRFAPFYKIFYSLPYASAIRIPGKFGHLVAWATLILFAYGAQALWVRYVASAPATTRGLLDQWRVWWAKVGTFDRRWIVGSGLAFVVLLALCAAYATHFRQGTEAYIAKLNFYEMMTQGQQPNLETAAAAAKAQMSFSVRQVAKAVFFYGAALGLVAICLTGYFGGARWKIAAALFGVLILGELGPASAPWVITYNWKEKYVDAANNPVIEFLRQRPHENRVAILSGSLPVQLGILDGVYGGDWKQHLFQYYNIQTIDIVQMPRVPVEVQTWESALHFNGSAENLHLSWRRWQLMNTRYLLGGAGMVDELNRQLQPNAPFRELMRFDFYQTRQGGPILTRTNAQAQYALIEYTGALPRAKLYSSWQVSTNDEATLQTLRSKEFDPAATVLVADSIAPATVTNATPGTVEFASYAPKKIALKTQAAAPSVLLLNDKHDPNWKVFVDGQAAALLRCNYVMRGVQLPAGAHTVEFRYQPPRGMLYISLAATALLLVLLGYTLWSGIRATKSA